MLNHIVIMGRLTRDPEIRRTGSDIPVSNFTVAVDRDLKNKNGEYETDFIDCVAWRKAAELIGRYFRKGSMIVVSGRLQLRDWTDKDGGKRRSAEIIADNVYFGESKRKEDQSARPQSGFQDTQSAMSRLPGDGYGGGDFQTLEDDDMNLPF